MANSRWTAAAPAGINPLLSIGALAPAGSILLRVLGMSAPAQVANHRDLLTFGLGAAGIILVLLGLRIVPRRRSTR